MKSIKSVGSSFYFELPVEIPEGQESFASIMRRDFANTYPPESAVLLVGDMPATQMMLSMACQQWGLSFQWEPKEGRVIRDLEQILTAQNYRWIFIAQDVSDRFWECVKPYFGEDTRTKIIQLRLPTERYGQRPLPHLYVPFSLDQLANCMLGRQDAPGTLMRNTPESNARGRALPKVLVVDDNEVNRRVACAYLKKMGFKCDIAEDGLQALDAVKNHDYGLVFMDCQMPVMDGYEATKAIRHYLKGNPLPIIAVTANAMEGDRDRCLGAGMSDYLPKPLRKERLQQVVDQWLPSANIVAL